MAKLQRFFTTDIAPDVYVKQCSVSELTEVVALAQKRLDIIEAPNSFTYTTELTMAAAEKKQ